ncbi:hypothetical protein HK097_008813 [Rhizophlyctis rosea]|uniref:Uncharacterized protein n=1 Tax=Rhizophlyctis rosea TaxID=64517 RepID=A0AAD5S9Y4_9FUNG|nr:hypothetical protein HK097_008813 [Rhizophlyctis rosea]
MGLMDKVKRHLELRKVSKYAGRRRGSTENHDVDYDPMPNPRSTASPSYDPPRYDRSEAEWHRKYAVKGARERAMTDSGVELERNIHSTLERARKSGGKAGVVTLHGENYSPSLPRNVPNPPALSILTTNPKEGILIDLSDHNPTPPTSARSVPVRMYAEPFDDDFDDQTWPYNTRPQPPYSTVPFNTSTPNLSSHTTPSSSPYSTSPSTPPSHSSTNPRPRAKTLQTTLQKASTLTRSSIDVTTSSFQKIKITTTTASGTQKYNPDGYRDRSRSFSATKGWWERKKSGGSGDGYGYGDSTRVRSSEEYNSLKRIEYAG